jgi:hypothetical protein
MTGRVRVLVIPRIIAELFVVDTGSAIVAVQLV